jgi:hypothetical protein
MGMLYEYEGFENLFESGTFVIIEAEYLEKVKINQYRSDHKVRIKWYPEAVDNDGQIKVVDNYTILNIRQPYGLIRLLKSGSKIQLRVEYIAYHREDYHIIQINSPKSGREDMLVHRSLFDIRQTMHPDIMQSLYPDQHNWLLENSNRSNINKVEPEKFSFSAVNDPLSWNVDAMVNGVAIK